MSHLRFQRTHKGVRYPRAADAYRMLGAVNQPWSSQPSFRCPCFFSFPFLALSLKWFWAVEVREIVGLKWLHLKKSREVWSQAWPKRGFLSCSSSREAKSGILCTPSIYKMRWHAAVEKVQDKEPFPLAHRHSGGLVGTQELTSEGKQVCGCSVEH